MILTWRGADTSGATEDLLKLLDSSIDWLLQGKTQARIVVNPNVASIQGLADRLASFAALQGARLVVPPGAHQVEH